MTEQMKKWEAEQADIKARAPRLASTDDRDDAAFPARRP